MQTKKPLPHLTIRQGPWAGTMVRFATVEQLRAVQRFANFLGADSASVIEGAFNTSKTLAEVRQLNAPQPKES